MALKTPDKLEKLRIQVYANRRRAGLPQAEFEAMFNPASFRIQHQNQFRSQQGMNTSAGRALYAYGRSDQVGLELVIDGSGLHRHAPLPPAGGGKGPVSAHVERFLDLCLRMDGELHQPRFLKIQWGDGPLSDFDCRLVSVAINYRSFEPNGAPRHAVLDTVFVEDLDPSKRLRRERKSSPDLTHRRTVRAGDTLPGLCRSIYGSTAPYLAVARFNQLDHFRELEVGSEILFPPLPADEDQRGGGA